jgi:glutathione S-transferase
MPFFIRPVAKGLSEGVLRTYLEPQTETHLRFVESELASRPWFAGAEFTAADVQMSFPLEAASARAGLDASKYPNTVGWLARIHARPAYQRALAKGGKYELS